MNKLVKALKNLTHTENMSLTYSDSGSDLLNLFALGGALRTREEEDIQRMFKNAFHEDARLALRCLFYLRDVRGGQGERRTFRTAFRWLALNHPEAVEKNLGVVYEYGRWDDLFVLEGTSVWPEVLNQLRMQLVEDQKNLEKGEPVSLLAKWLPSVNTSSREKSELGKRLAYAFGLNEKSYRKTLSALRKAIDVVEKKMSRNRWSDIDFEKVPSKAGMNYRKAFLRHERERYEAYIQAVERGEKKINAATLYPYEIIEKVLYQGEDNATLDVLWKNLPDYLKGNQHNGLVVADVSGSMIGRPMAIAISMAMYFAERVQGEFNNHFITFSNEPEFVQIKGDTLYEKAQFISQAPWGGNTDIQKVFELILKRARMNKVPQEDMPDTIYIISDMEFDQAATGMTNYEFICRHYRTMGYENPTLVFWNVDARHDHFPLQMDEKGTILVSGSSPSIFEQLLSGELKSPYEFLKDVLLGERYDLVSA
ncbi:MAG TPA: DUF2828 family protein [Thermotogota bacterium]|nr:DUF2828 family protein [Thermotogota bacterium]